MSESAMDEQRMDQRNDKPIQDQPVIVGVGASAGGLEAIAHLLAKIDAGKLEVKRERIAPDVIISDIVSLMNARAEEKDVMQGDQDSCMEARCTAFVSKPIDKVALLKTLANVSSAQSNDHSNDGGLS